jgi:hypothetical protein
MRVGWRLLQNRLSQPPAPKAQTPQSVLPQPRAEVVPPRRARRTIHIRSSWAVTNGNGVWQEGTSEHTIELDD